MTRPRIGFLGVGWIGRHRMAAMLDTGLAEAAAIADPSPEMAAEAAKLAPGAVVVDGLDAMLAMELDGVVVATPSALHAEQSIAALEAGAAVFCQKPLGRDAAEAARVVDAARRADRLLDVDFSYRHAAGMRAIRELVRSGALGRVFAVDLTFHNAYGPDKPWFYDRALSGGGCVMDLGVHLVDLAMWTLGEDAADDVASQLFAEGQPLRADGESVEDYAIAQMRIGGASVRLACSWKVHAGVDADIVARFYGTSGGATFANVGGSFYEFQAHHHRGSTDADTLGDEPPGTWTGRAAADWARRLAGGARFDPAADGVVAVARVLDLIYSG